MKKEEIEGRDRDYLQMATHFFSPAPHRWIPAEIMDESDSPCDMQEEANFKKRALKKRALFTVPLYLVSILYNLGLLMACGSMVFFFVTDFGYGSIDSMSISQKAVFPVGVSQKNSPKTRKRADSLRNKEIKINSMPSLWGALFPPPLSHSPPPPSFLTFRLAQR